MQLTPLIAVHMTAALGAIATGPVALWARKGRTQRPRLHRAFGYAWVTLMLVTAISALFIRDYRLPNIAGYTPIHLLVPATLFSLFGSFWKLAHGDIAGHRSIMQRLYVGACVVAGVFTLVPGRYLGNLVWGQWLGLMSPTFAPPAGAPPVLMIVRQILAGTPLWVWGLLAGLVVLGVAQARARQIGLVRASIVPVAMGGLSLLSIVSVFGASPAVLGSWLAAGLVLALLVMLQGAPAGTRYDAATRRFDLPGSWVPLVLFLAIFATRYAVSVSFAMHPGLKADAGFALAVAALYGVFTGLFAGRAARLVRLALRPATASRPVPVNA
jgi:uncharacterized membrane protein